MIQINCTFEECPLSLVCFGQAPWTVVHNGLHESGMAPKPSVCPLCMLEFIS